MYPKISVITPSFRGERLIETTIRSVLDQQYPNLEYIVLDGAGDHTGEILRRYDKQIAYWRSSPDEGRYEAINEGFARASGDIFCWINSDDLFLPRSFFIVAEIFSKFSEVKWLSTLKAGDWDANSYFCGIGNIPGFSKDAFLDGFFLPETRLRGCWIPQESTFFTRGLWTEAGGRIPKDYPLAGDFALWCEFYKITDLYGVDYPLAGFRSLAGQRSEAIEQYRKEAGAALASLRKYEDWRPTFKINIREARLSHLPKIRDAVKMGFGYEGKKIFNADVKKFGALWQMDQYKFLP